eukprot:1160186-Pelagomonas_calceolata.AAC.3
MVPESVAKERATAWKGSGVRGKERSDSVLSREGDLQPTSKPVIKKNKHQHAGGEVRQKFSRELLDTARLNQHRQVDINIGTKQHCQVDMIIGTKQHRQVDMNFGTKQDAAR